MPLAVCCLTALLLLDRCDVAFLHPSLNSHLASVLHQRVTLDAEVSSAVERTERGARVIVSIPEKVLLTAADPAVLDGLEESDLVRFNARLKRPVRYQNPGQFDYRRSLERQGVLLSGFVEAGDVDLIGKGPSAPRFVDRMRGAMNRRLEELVGGEEGGLLKAFITGERSGVTEEIWDDFRKTGTSHLIAISGQHVVILAGGVFATLFWVLKRSERLLLKASPKKMALGASLVPVFLYTAIAGAPPSAVRAAILFAAMVLGACLDHEADLWSGLSLAAILIASVDPSAPFTASFQLSFLAVIGMSVFRHRRDAARRVPTRMQRYLKNPFWMTLGATLATAPLVAYRFHQISISGVLTNLWAVPAAGLVLIAGGSALCVSLAAPSLGAGCLKAAGLLTHLFLEGIRLNADWAWTLSFYPTEREMILLFAAVGLVAWLRLRPHRWRRVVVGMVLLLGVQIVPGIFCDSQAIEITFLDVGQGDTALVIAPGGKALLVDAGGFLIPFGNNPAPRFDVGKEVVVPYLKMRGIRRLDAVLLSHPHPDHFGGLASVVETIPIREFWWSGQAFPESSFDRLMQSLDAHGVPRRILKAGDRFEWEGCGIEVFYPDKVRPGRSINDNSLVVRLSYAGASVLLTGDIEDEGEGSLADKLPIHADVLKIPHHGSRTSSSVPFIDSVKPAYAVVSLGDENLFGFPHAGILEKYKRRGIEVFRTDKNGAVTFTWGRDFPKRPISIRAVSSSE